MTTMNVIGERVFGPEDFRAWMDRMARAVFGMTGSEFATAYKEGRLTNDPTARSLASVIPLTVKATLPEPVDGGETVTG